MYKSLFHLLSTDFQTTADALDAVVAFGLNHFDADVGIVSKIVDSDYQIVAACAPSMPDLKPGLSLPVEDTFCKLVCEHQTTIAIPDTSDSVLAEHPFVQSHHLTSYISTPIMVGGEVFGTLNFTSKRAKVGGFTKEDEQCVVALAGICRLWLLKVDPVTVERDRALADLTLILDHVPSLIFFKDEKNHIVRANRAAAAQLGLDPDELAGRHSKEFYEHADKYFEDDLAVLNSGQAKLGYIEPVTSTSGLRYVRTDKIPVSTNGEAMDRILAIATDVTEEVQAEERRKAYEAELKQAKDAAEAADRTKSNFLARMSHEIRTPMTAILGFADLMLNPAQSRVEQVSALQAIRRNGAHLISLINDMLDLSKVEAGQLEVVEEQFDPMTIASDVLSSIRPRAREKGIQLELRDAGALPRWIRSDPLRVRQVLYNLLSNAVKFTRVGSVTLELSCDTQADGQVALTAAVIDTGIGIAAEHFEGLFEPFCQVDPSMSREFGGTGLGLSICRNLAALLGGRIEMTSKLGEGSTFRMELLLGADAVGPVERRAVREVLKDRALSHAEADRDYDLYGKRVLLAEDGIDNQRILKAFLELAHAEVTIVDDGQQAVERVMEAFDAYRPFDFVLMDMQMPVLDGYGAVAELRRRGYTGLISALTAHAMVEEQTRCMTAGCDLFLSKPIDRKSLVRAIAMAIEGRKHGDAPQVESAVASERTMRLTSPFANDPDLCGPLADFVESLPLIARDIDHARKSDDRPALRRICHQLKGSAGLYVLPRISAAAREIERVEGGERSDLDVAVDELLELMRSVDGYHESAA